jgi:hypothetical protein
MARHTGTLMVILLVTGGLATAQDSAPAEQYTGRIVDAAGAVPGASSTYFTLRIESYTPDEEVAELYKVGQEGGQQALLDALWNTKPRGWIKVGRSLGYDVAVIRSLPREGGGRLIRVVCDRPIQFFEVRHSLRSKGYPFGLIELELGPDGTGQGAMIAAAEARFTAEGKVEIVSLGTQPFKILKVKPEKVKAKKSKD